MPQDAYQGQHLWVWRTGYTHHGLGDGEGGVIHYSGLADGLASGPVCRVTLEEFARGREIHVREHSDRRFSCKDAVQRAADRLGENGYSVPGNNCEHFVEWCITGNHRSRQVDRVAGGAGVVFTARAASGAATLVASEGTVVGLSASGVMSGLGSVGGVVGGGVVAGLGVLGASGGVGMAMVLNNTILADGDDLPPEEREARSIGRMATYAGAATGTVGGIVAVSAAGTTAGLSAAGISSGLAAIGGTVGGTMATGTMIVAAAPVAAALVIGVGVYKLWKWFD